MDDPGGLGIAHGVTRCEGPEFPSHETIQPDVLKLLGPTGEVPRRIQGAVLVDEGIAEVLDALLLVLDVRNLEDPRVVLVMLLEDLVGRLDVGPVASLSFLLDAIVWRLLHVLVLPDMLEGPGAPGGLHVGPVDRIWRCWTTHRWQRTWRNFGPGQPGRRRAWRTWRSWITSRRRAWRTWRSWIKAIEELVFHCLWRDLVMNEVLPDGLQVLHDSWDFIDTGHEDPRGA